MSGDAQGSGPWFVADRLAVTVTAALVGAAAVSWIVLNYAMPAMGSGMMGVASVVSSVSVPAILVFELVWAVGMVAMMFPAMIPVVLFYNRLATRSEPNPKVARAVGTPLFLLGYLATYAALGLVAYLGVYFALAAASQSAALSSIGFLAPALVLLVAGAYQLSPLKVKALSVCISPLGFFAVHLRKGLTGSLRMGAVHGGYCVGCCWAYMLVMLAVAAMSLPVMLALAGVIAFEKVLARGAVWFNRGVGLALLAGGFVLLAFPEVLMFA